MIRRPVEQTKSPQPEGADGVQNTWNRVADKALVGGEDARVRSHVTYVLKACGWPYGARARAECLLADCRTLRHVDDPVNAEFIPDAWLMMPDHVAGTPAMFVAEDCDGLTVRWLAMCLAAGIHCKVVGLEYSAESGRHVAGLIWDPEEGEWLDGDPSMQDLPLGKRLPSSRRQERELPSMKITCDDEYCPTNVPPEDRGVDHFVSVGTPPAPEVPPAETLAAEVLAELGQEMQDVSASLKGRGEELKGIYDAMRARFAAYGVNTLADLAPFGWTQQNQIDALDAVLMTSVATAALDDAVAGKRGVWPVASDSGLATYAIEKLPSDKVAIVLSADGTPSLVDASTGAVAHGDANNSIGSPVLIAAAAAVCWVAAAYAISKVVDALSRTADTVAETFLESKIDECLTLNPPCSPEEYQRRVEERHQYQLAKLAAEAKYEESKAKAPGPLDGAVSAFNKIVYVAGGVAAIYGAIKVLQALTSKRSA